MCTSFSSLEVTKVNTYGIVLRWEGLDPFLYPVLITAHQGDARKLELYSVFLTSVSRRCPCGTRDGKGLGTPSIFGLL